MVKSSAIRQTLKRHGVPVVVVLEQGQLEQFRQFRQLSQEMKSELLIDVYERFFR